MYEKKGSAETLPTSERSTEYQTTPQQAYYDATRSQRPRFLTPKTFRAAINARLDNPYVSVFRLGLRVLQLVFALAAGISYGIELDRKTMDSSANTSFIYAQVVFGITLLTIIIDTITIRSYKFVWMGEWVLAILWIALFGTFYTTYHVTTVEPEFEGTNVGNMRRIVWIDLISALLWMTSAMFSTTLCCSGMRAKVRGKKEQWRMKREAKKRNGAVKTMGEMEQGTVRTEMHEEDLPHYEELPEQTHS